MTVLSLEKTPVAREIRMELKQHGERIVEENAPSKRVLVADFIDEVFPDQIIEHLGRLDMVKLSQWEFSDQQPSSLFYQSVHKAYADHHALGLRPEVLMYLINSVVAETVRRHPDSYRQLFTEEPEKSLIKVWHHGLQKGNPESPWREAVGMFEVELRKRIPSQLLDQMLPSFSTATMESNTSSLLSFMDAASPFYDYSVGTRCGIPRIVLFGEANDYRRLEVASGELAEVFSEHLGEYFGKLLPVLKTIADTAEGGEVDSEFWGQLYKSYDGSGKECYDGWIATFLWYVHQSDNRSDYRPDAYPLVSLPERTKDWSFDEDTIASGSEPTHVSRVPFIWDYFGEDTPMEFIGGILGVEVEEGALTPQLSYGVLNVLK